MGRFALRVGERPLPTIVDVHGGPLGGWAPAPHVEVTLLVARGYRVLLPDIRGAAGYGRDWIRPQLGDWGASTPMTSTPHSTTPSPSASRTRIASGYSA